MKTQAQTQEQAKPFNGATIETLKNNGEVALKQTIPSVRMASFDLNDYDVIQKLSKELFLSKLFSAGNPSEIFAKIMTGKELGIPPIASIMGINIIKGKPGLGAHLIATLVANSQRYSFKVIEKNDKICKIEFFEYGKLVGVEVFSIEDARKADLINKDNWKHYPKSMLYSRCISQGARTYAAGAFGGIPIYTAEELGDEALIDEAEIIDGESMQLPQPPKIEDYKLEQKSNDLALPEQIEKIKNLIVKLQKEENYSDKVMMAKYGHTDIAQASSEFVATWIIKLEKQSADVDTFKSEYDNTEVKL